MRTITLTEAEARMLLGVCERITRGEVLVFGGKEHRYFDIYRSNELVAALERVEKKIMQQEAEEGAK